MNTKQMYNRLREAGCIFAQDCNNDWTCSLEGLIVATHRQLGQLVWKAARYLGED